MAEEEKLISVGKFDKKKVTTFNHELFEKARKIMEDNQGSHHIGWIGLGYLIDWLEENYNITPKGEE